jgi:hypothetical protein
VNITKKTVANTVSKSIPVIGGLISGTITYVSMSKMANRLLDVLTEVNFHYTDEEMLEDIKVVESQSEDDVIIIDAEIVDEPKQSLLDKSKEKLSLGKDKLTSMFKKKEKNDSEDYLDKIKKLKELLDIGAISEEEYNQKKIELLGFKE